MSELLSILLAYPTVIYTAFLGLVLLYWLFVILGALDIDLFQGDADGMLDAAAAKGEAMDGLLDAAAAKGEAAGGLIDAAAAKGEAMDGLLDGAAAKGEAAGELLDGGDGAHGGAEGLLHAINLRRAPITVTFSFIIFFSWIASYLAVTFAGPALAGILPAWLTNTLVLVGALLLSLPLTSLATKPLESVFKQQPGQSRSDFIGSMCRISTGRVDERFGQATVEDGGAGLIIQVRGEGANLKRGARALIIDFDQEREAYVVEAYDTMLEEEQADQRARR